MSLRPLPPDIQPRGLSALSPSQQRKLSEWQGIYRAERINVERQRRRQEMFEEQLRSPGSERRTDLVPLGPDTVAG